MAVGGHARVCPCAVACRRFRGGSPRDGLGAKGRRIVIDSVCFPRLQHRLGHPSCEANAGQEGGPPGDTASAVWPVTWGMGGGVPADYVGSAGLVSDGGPIRPAMTYTMCGERFGCFRRGEDTDDDVGGR